MTKTCEYCGNEYQASHKKQKYCSKECSGKARDIRYETHRSIYRAKDKNNG